METFRSLGHHCYDNICHCDWRITIYGCVESNAARIVNILNISLSAMVLAIGFGLLYQRIVIKGHSILDSSPKEGILRPKPIDSMICILIVFMMIRLVSSIVLVTDVAADNMVFRSFLFEFGWEFGLWGCGAYLIGVIQASAESHKSISSSWLPSPRVVDAAGLTLIIAPFILNNASSLAAGILATSNLEAADICIELLHIFWFFHCGTLGCGVLYCASRLVQSLNQHLNRLNSTGERYTKIKTGIFKIRTIMMLISAALLIFAVSLLLYGILRDEILKNFNGSIFVCAVWNILGPITAFVGEIAIMFEPKIDQNPKAIYINGQSTTVFETQNGTKVSGGMDVTFQDTLTNTALEDLKLNCDVSSNKQVIEEPFEPVIYKANFHSCSSYNAGIYMQDSESQYEFYELQHHNSKAHLIDRKY